MKGVASFARRVRDLVGAKLGRCARCMRWSIAWSLAGWAVFAVGSLARPSRILLDVSLVVAGSFTLLAIGHMVAHMARIAVALRERGVGSRSLAVQDLPRALGRRQLVSTAVTGGITFALASLLPASARAAPQGTAIPPFQRILRALVKLLQMDQVSRDELFRIAATAQVAQRSGLPFQFVWEQSRHQAGLEQQGLLPTIVVSSFFQGPLSFPPGDSVTMEKFVSAPGEEIREFTFQNNCSVPVHVDGQAGDLYFAKTLGPGDFLRIADPAFLPILFIVARYAVVAVAAACVTERTIVSIVAAQPVPCRLITGYTKCSQCSGDCPPGTTCQGTSFSTCYGYWVEPDTCGCL
jgi:hypothetical protein